MTQYILCGSDSEEEAGEISLKPANALILKQSEPWLLNTNLHYSSNYFHNQTFIGPNKKLTRDRITLSENKAEYLKNKFKKTVPFSYVINFILKPLFKTQFIEKIEVSSSDVFTLIDVNSNATTVTDPIFHHCKVHLDRYVAITQSITEYKSNKETKVILISDTVLGRIANVFARFTVIKNEFMIKIIFKDLYFEEISLDKAIELYGESCVSQSIESTECRTYKCGDTVMIVFSSTFYKNNGKEMRINKGIDVSSNCKALVTENNVTIISSYDEGIGNAIHILNGIEVEEDGEYILKGNEIHKIIEESDEQVLIEYS